MTKVVSYDCEINCKEVLQGLGKFIDAKGCGGRADFAQTGGRNKVAQLAALSTPDYALRVIVANYSCEL